MRKRAGKDSLPIVGFIGGYLIDSGALTLEQLDYALVEQIKLADQGRVMPLDRLLLELKLVTNDQLMRAVARRAADEHKARLARQKAETGRKRR